MIFAAAILATSACLFFLSFFPAIGVSLTLVLKPLIDASWNSSVAGINCLMIIGVAVPILILPRILFSREKPLTELVFPVVGLMYLFSNFLGVAGILSTGNIMNSIEFFARVINGFLGFFMFQFYFSDRENFKKMLFILLIAGLFPLCVGLYQMATGNLWQVRQTVGLTRNVGLYHDAFSIRAFGFQSLTAVLLMWEYFTHKKNIYKVVLGLYGALWCLVIFKAYSKAAFITFAIWLVIWSFCNKKIHWLIIISALVLAANFSADNIIFSDVEIVFQKEIGIAEGVEVKERAFAGRGFVWSAAINDWKKTGIVEKIIGTGENWGVHNEFLRILFVNGLLGLFIYVIIFVYLGWKTVMNMLKRASPLNVMAVMIYCMFALDNIGLHPGLYPAYQWYIFGFITLAIRGVDGLDVDSKPVIQAAYPSYGSVYADKDC